MHLYLDPTDRVFQDPERTWALIRLWQMADDQGALVATFDQLADTWAVSRHTVQRLVRELEAGGWLESTGRRGRTPCYRLTGQGIAREEDPGLDASGVPAPNPPNRPAPGVTLPEPVASEAPHGTTHPTPPLRSGQDATRTEASRLLHAHVNAYQDRFSQPFLVAWPRDTAIYRRLVKTYGVETVERLQGLYLAQSLTSFAAKRGFSVPQFASEIAHGVEQEALREQLNGEQQTLVDALVGEGMDAVRALSLVHETPASQVRGYLATYQARKASDRPWSLAQLERAIRERWVMPAATPVPQYPLFPGIPEMLKAGPDDTRDHDPSHVAGIADTSLTAKESTMLLGDWLAEQVLKV